MCEIIPVWVKVAAVARADSHIKIFVLWIIISTPALRKGERSLNPQVIRAVRSVKSPRQIKPALQVVPTPFSYVASENSR